MKLKLRTLTPIHIGSGSEIPPLGYLMDQNGFSPVDMEALFADPDLQPVMEKFINSASAGVERDIEKLLGGKITKNLIREKYLLYTIPIQGGARNSNKTTVKEFIKSGGRVYIPGSSLKGSLLSAVLRHYLKQTKDQEVVRKLEEGRKGREEEKAFSNILNKAFPLFSEGPSGDRFNRWLALSDSNFYSPAQALQLSLVKVVGGAGRKSPLPILMETLKAGLEFEFDVKVLDGRFSLPELLNIVDDFYRTVKKKDGKESFQSNKFLVRVGTGSTAFSTSFIILAEDLKVKNYMVKPPRTRKMVDSQQPLGWAELSLI